MTTAASAALGHQHHHHHNSCFRVYGVPLTILVALFVVSWSTEFSSLTALGILDDHRKTSTNKPYTYHDKNNTGDIHKENETTAVSPFVTTETPQQIPQKHNSHPHYDFTWTQNDSNGDTHEDPSTITTTTPTTLPPPWPIQVLHDYKQQHSVHALIQDDDNIRHRKFAVVYYYCPHRAGNILHNLFISVTWAMIHNRTILWKYDTDFTTHRNTVQDCQKILERATWVASWDEWAPRLGFVLSSPAHARQEDDDDDFHTVVVPIPIDPSRVQYDVQHRVVAYPQIKDVMKSHSQLFRTEWRDDPSHSRNNLLYIQGLGDEEAKLRTAKLYDHGVDFLFGMLFREMFTVKVAVDNPFHTLRPNNTTSSHDVFSLALHSRHTVIGDDGSYITDEIKCLQQLLPNTKSRTPETCVVYLMSDRPRTIQKLSTWLKQHNCTGVTASPTSPAKNNNNHTGDKDVVSSTALLLDDEMGPNQGEGYIRELELASAARSGLIGDIRRSSFMLLVELVEYERQIENWRNGTSDSDDNKNNNNRKKLPHCHLPERHGSGYNYGPGTPTFRAAHHRDPLAPIQMLDEYKSLHSAKSLRKETTWSMDAKEKTGRQFVVGYLPCPVDSSIEGVRSFLNVILLAVATNRTVLWKYANIGSENNNNTLALCDRFLQPHDWLPRYDDFFKRLQPNGTDELQILSEKSDNSSVENRSTNPPQVVVVVFPEQLQKEKLNLSSLVMWGQNSSQAEALYSEGVDFLYGMLLEEAFRFRAIVTEPTLLLSNEALFRPEASLTVGIHVDSISQMEQTNRCLETSFLNSTSITGRCDIYLATLDPRLKELDRLGNCTIHTLTNRDHPRNNPLDNVSSTSLRFYQDLLYCSKQVRSGFIGTAGSSASAFFVERIEYLRRIETWKQGRIPRILPEFKTCQA